MVYALHYATSKDEQVCKSVLTHIGMNFNEEYIRELLNQPANYAETFAEFQEYCVEPMGEAEELCKLMLKQCQDDN